MRRRLKPQWRHSPRVGGRSKRKPRLLVPGLPRRCLERPGIKVPWTPRYYLKAQITQGADRDSSLLAKRTCPHCHARWPHGKRVDSTMVIALAPPKTAAKKRSSRANARPKPRPASRESAITPAGLAPFPHCFQLESREGSAPTRRGERRAGTGPRRDGLRGAS